MSLVSDQIQNTNFCNMFEEFATKGLEEGKECPAVLILVYRKNEEFCHV